MTRYTPDSRDRVRDAVDMLALVGAKTELRRAGVNSYFGLCPFHDERTGSFHVSPEEKLYHCFGCGESGDPFDFVMATEGLDFKGALETLADRFGVTLEVEDEDPAARARRERRERLHALLDRAAGYYMRYLWESSEAAPAREYLARRGLRPETLRAFRVGYAPSAWDRMLLASRQAGFSEEELLATGLAQRSRQRPGTLYDRFRERIMFPLANARGRVVGFGARAMRDNQRPKYLNTSDGEVFQKGRQLFGIDVARRAAARAGAIVLAEGYMDVLALHQAGVEHAVGLMGTSLTDEQARELERTARTLLLALDADRAGQDAMVRAARVAAGRRLKLRVVELPDGRDPADLVLAEGAAAMRERVARSVPFASFHVDAILDRGELGDAEGKDRAIAALGPVIAQVPPSVLREELIDRIARRLELARELTAELLARAAQAAPDADRPSDPAPGRDGAPADGVPPGGSAAWEDDPGPDPGRPDPPFDGAPPVDDVASAPLDPALRHEREFLALCVAHPREGAAALAQIDPEHDLRTPVARRAAVHLAVPGRLEEPEAGVPADDDELRALVEELVRSAAAVSAVPASVEHARLLLERHRLAREIAAARAAGSGGVADLKRREWDVLRRLRALADEIQASA